MTPTLASYSAGVAPKIPDFQTDAYCAIPTSPEISSNVHFPIMKKQPEISQGWAGGGEVSVPGKKFFLKSNFQPTVWIIQLSSYPFLIPRNSEFK